MDEALIASMREVRLGQRNRGILHESVGVKNDTTIITTADKDSDAAGKAVLIKIPGIRVHGEESGADGSNEIGITLYLDGLDGSMPFAIGAGTSTVIVAATDKTGRVIHCLVGEPSSARVWAGGIDEPTKMWYVDGIYGGEEDLCRRVHVGDAPLSGKTRVLIDSYPGFTRGGRTILTTAELDKLHAKIQSVSGLMMLGSNGMHHALVASGGGKSQPAAITTAIGGPWDVAPVLLVLQAGGSARAFHVSDETGKLEERDPLQIADYDIVVSGNKGAVETLSKMLLSLRR
jgi:fructose-1,6-bisphosphatase/inositol monophosphatase family enzyme